MRALSVASRCSAVAAMLAFAGCAGDRQFLGAAPNVRAPMTLTSGTESVVHSFGAAGDGSVPKASLVDADGTLYGTTSAGGDGVGSLCGPGGCGTVFRIATDGSESVVYNFSGADGVDPEASLIDVKGTLYGTTIYGGAGYQGVIFSVTAAGKERVLHSFTGTPDGAGPQAGLIEVGGKLYGTTSEGGAYGNGTVYSITRAGRERVLYSFKGGSYGDGASPSSALTVVGGNLYGTTTSGGSGVGTVFEITTSGRERVVYRFAPYRHDAKYPGATLVNLNGKLYGTSPDGGGNNDGGTVFSVTTSGRERVLHAFKGVPDGSTPFGGLLDVDGTLYGTTWVGGLDYSKFEEGVGTVFSIKPSGKKRVVYRFAGAPDGALPGAGLTDVNGTLYGTAASGGTYPPSNCPGAGYEFGCGVVFELSPSSPQL